MSSINFQIGDTVILLDTERKPAGNAVIVNCNDDLTQFKVEFTYPGTKKSEQFFVPVERLLSM